MILIADSGSTKTEWCLFSKENNITQSCITKGINPFHQTSSDIYNSLQEQYSLPLSNIHEIYFYGAGCSDFNKKSIVKKALNNFFKAPDIKVYSDLLAAAHSLCQHSPGIACILGTGSNSCYYNGQKIIQNVSPLGYIIGDEGSGAVMGKKLIADLLKNQLTKSLIHTFFDVYKTSKEEIMERIYKTPFPNRYLAQFTKFILNHIDDSKIESLVMESFNEFIVRNILQYNHAQKHNINFTGSIAYYFKTQLEKALSEHNLKIGTITQSPLPGLINYYNSIV